MKQAGKLTQESLVIPSPSSQGRSGCRTAMGVGRGALVCKDTASLLASYKRGHTCWLKFTVEKPTFPSLRSQVIWSLVLSPTIRKESRNEAPVTSHCRTHVILRGFIYQRLSRYRAHGRASRQEPQKQSLIHSTRYHNRSDDLKVWSPCFQTRVSIRVKHRINQTFG